MSPLRNLLLSLGLLLAGLAGAQDSTFDPENCLFCHGKPWMAVSDSAGVRNFTIDEGVHKSSVHGRFACRQCHADIDQVPHKAPVQKVNCAVACHVIDPYTGADYSHQKMAQDLATSVHGKTGKGPYDHRKPVCKDCHFNSVYWQKLPDDMERAKAKCLTCHENYNGLDEDFKHLALHISEDEYWRHQQNFEACIRCHSDNELVSDSLEALLIDGTMVSSFLESFHGRGFNFGDKRSPVCADCHGHHNILSHQDEKSMINPANLQKTCSTTGCHDGATVSFATAGSMHNLYQGTKVQALVWVKNIYIWIILLTLGGMMGHNVLDYIAYRRHRKAHAAAHEEKPEGAVRRVFRRLTPAERISHVIMFTSFTLLALTGVMLWIPPERFGTLVRWEYFMPVRDWSHRVAAILLTLVSFYHLGYAVLSKRGRALMWAMLPGPSDLGLISHNIKFMLGLRKDRPAFGFFNYGEKMEYWAFAWGSVVMTGTGIILWLEQLGSKFIVDLARLVHSLEAILAVAAIVVWHFWNVHWKPSRWPMSEVWIDGKMGEEDMEEEHGALMEPDAVEKYGPILVNEVTGAPERRRTTRKALARTLGWTFLALTIVTCAAMVWSFRLYLGVDEGPDPNDVVAQWCKRPLADKEAALADPSYPLRVAHEDVDWRHRRFHDAQPVVTADSTLRQSECLLCHSVLPHQVDRKTRAYLNLHSRFMTCESCHAKESDRKGAEWSWLDLRRQPQGEPKAPYKLTGMPPYTGLDNYTSLLGLKVGGKPLYADLDSPRALEYRKSTAPMTQARMKDTKDRFHDRIQSGEGTGASCGECHVPEGGLLDFHAVGFDDERVRQLRSSAITASVTDNEVFFLPPAY